MRAPRSSRRTAFCKGIDRFRRNAIHWLRRQQSVAWCNGLMDTRFLPRRFSGWPMAKGLLDGGQPMKNISVALVATITLVHSARGQDLKTSTDRAASDYLENRFGAGLMVGEPTGLSLKYWLNQD